MSDLARGSRDVRPVLRKYRQALYDEEKVGNGAPTTSVQLFARRRGEQDNAGHVKTLRDTNLQANGSLGSKQEFYLVGFNVMFDWDLIFTDTAHAISDAATNEIFVIQQLITDSLFTFNFGRQTNLVEIPLERIPFGMGPNGMIDNNTVLGGQAIAHVVANGVPSVREFYDVRLKKNRPRHIQPDMYFNCEISWLNGAITIGTDSGDEYYRIMVYAIGVLLSAL